LLTAGGEHHNHRSAMIDPDPGLAIHEMSPWCLSVTRSDATLLSGQPTSETAT
jgi:hypothetical protein